MQWISTFAIFYMPFQWLFLGIKRLFFQNLWGKIFYDITLKNCENTAKGKGLCFCTCSIDDGLKLSAKWCLKTTWTTYKCINVPYFNFQGSQSVNMESMFIKDLRALWKISTKHTSFWIWDEGYTLLLSKSVILRRKCLPWNYMDYHTDC